MAPHPRAQKTNDLAIQEGIYDKMIKQDDQGAGGGRRLPVQREEKGALNREIVAHSGPGHSCGIHTVNDLRIKELSHQVRVSRILVRQPCAWEHLLTYTRVSHPIPNTQPSDI
jgi:hypothetical protein